MTPSQMNQHIGTELAQLRRNGLLDAKSYARLCARYPHTTWDWLSLGRWFSIFGAIATFAGGVFIYQLYFEFSYPRAAVGAATLTGGLFVAGRLLARRGLRLTAKAAELLAGLSLIGLSFLLGIVFSTGSGNWPALLLIDLPILLALAYLLHNILLLILSAVVFFFWFGGFTGYASGWGAYWFGMNYPLRFLIAAPAMALFGFAHLHNEAGALGRWAGFSKVWIAAGLFFAEMALWLLSLFGNFNLDDSSWKRASAEELLAFNLLWAGSNLGLILAGNRYAFRMLTGFGATFLIIHVYTLFFAHVAGHVGTFLSFAITGTSALALAVWLERRLRGGLE